MGEKKDRGRSTDLTGTLTCMWSAMTVWESGYQYRGSYLYFGAESVVDKVSLAVGYSRGEWEVFQFHSRHLLAR